MLIILIVSMPFTLAQVGKKEVGKEETGGFLSATIPEDNFLEGQLTDVNIIVNRYEPTVLVSSILEEQNVPIYAFLSATPTSSTELPRIQKVTITEVKGNKSSTTGVKYYEPRVWSWDDIGFIELRLKKIEKEHKVPDKISVDLKARIEYEADVTSSLIGGAQTKVLEETPMASFQDIITDRTLDVFGGKAHIVLRQVGSNSAIFSIHDSEGKLITTMTALLGRDSAAININPGSNQPEDQVRIRLNKILDTTKPYAVVSIDKLDHILYKNTKILDWNVDGIVVKNNQGYVQLTKIGANSGKAYLVLGKSEEIKQKISEIKTQTDDKREISLMQTDFEKLLGDWGSFEVKKIELGTKPQAIFRIGGEPDKNVSVGEVLTPKGKLAISDCADPKPNNEDNVCKLESIQGGRVLIKHPEQDLATKKCKIISSYLSLRNLDRRYLSEEILQPNQGFLDTLPSSLCGETVIFEGVETGKSVEVTLLSGTSRGVTETQFSLNIPIEKRLVKFSPRSLDNKINSTQKLIERLTKTIDKLEKVVETWTKICLATTAIFTIWNFITYDAKPEEAVKPLKVEEAVKKSGLTLVSSGTVCTSAGGGFEKLVGFKDSPTEKGNDIFVNANPDKGFYYYIEDGKTCREIPNSVIYKGKEEYQYNPSTGLYQKNLGLNADQRNNILITKDNQGRNVVVIPIKSANQLAQAPILREQYRTKWETIHGDAAGAIYLVYYENDRVEVWKGLGEIDLISKTKEENDIPIGWYTKGSDSTGVYLEVERKFIQGRLSQAQKKGFSEVDLFGEKYKIDSSKKIRTTEIQCEDVLGPVQCKLMYNACDPVMCPASRCNLGGVYEVKDDNVIQSGLIGSFILCAPNFIGASGDVAVPICLSGILASLKNIRSYLQAYKACLITAKADDKAVGICDKVRSIFMCEIIWKEVMTLLNQRGGVLNFLITKVTGGGGEYLSPRVDQAKKTVDYFTQSYATTIFAGYKGKTTEQIGSEICRSAIGGAFPNLGKLMDQASKPEDPPQFTAYFEEHEYSSSLGTSRYNIYYHIYAGSPRQENKIINYYVFLKSQGLRDFPIAKGGLKSGEYADASKDVLAPKNYQEICIGLDGKVQCGFGKIVSSSFGINQIANTYIAEDLAAKITKADQCIPSQQSALSSYSVGFVPSAAVERRCSYSNPYLGLSTEKEREWYVIGECGTDRGNSIGKCWEHANLERYPEIQSEVFADSCTENRNANLCHVYEKCQDGAVIGEFNIKTAGPLLNQAFGDNSKNDIGVRQCCTGTCKIISETLNKAVSDAIDDFGEQKPIAKLIEDVARKKEGAFSRTDLETIGGSVKLDLLPLDKTAYLMALLELKYHKDYASALEELIQLQKADQKKVLQEKKDEFTRKGVKEILLFYQGSGKADQNEIIAIDQLINKKEINLDDLIKQAKDIINGKSKSGGTPPVTNPSPVTGSIIEKADGTIKLSEILDLKKEEPKSKIIFFNNIPDKKFTLSRFSDTQWQIEKADGTSNQVNEQDKTIEKLVSLKIVVNKNN